MKSLEGFSFADPWWLLLLAVLPLFAFLSGRVGGAPAVSFSSTDLLRQVGTPRRNRLGGFLLPFLLLPMALFIVALARPQLGKTLTQVEASGIDIMLVIDVSKSMLAEDFRIGNQRANRLEAIKNVTEEFIKARPNDRIGITAFAGRPYLVSPPTLDHDWLQKNLERIQIGLVEDGTAIGSAIVSACNRLKNRQSKTKFIVLLTDGDNNAGKVQPATAAEAARALGIKVYTIGAGTNGLVPVPAGRDLFGQIVYAQTRYPLDEESLKQIASIADGKYYRATDTGSLKKIYEDIDQLEKSVIQMKQYKQYRELFMWATGAGALLLAIGIVISHTTGSRVP
jgi:Ca-activated chloride channel family protein